MFKVNLNYSYCCSGRARRKIPDTDQLWAVNSFTQERTQTLLVSYVVLPLPGRAGTGILLHGIPVKYTFADPAKEQVHSARAELEVPNGNNNVPREQTHHHALAMLSLAFFPGFAFCQADVSTATQQQEQSLSNFAVPTWEGSVSREKLLIDPKELTVTLLCTHIRASLAAWFIQMIDRYAWNGCERVTSTLQK